MEDRDRNKSNIIQPRTSIKNGGLCEDLHMIFSYNPLHGLCKPYFPFYVLDCFSFL